MATSSNTAKQLLTSCVRQTRLLPVRGGKPPSPVCQRFAGTAAAVQPDKDTVDETQRWQQHRVHSAEPPRKRPRIDALRNEQEPRTFSSFLTDNYSRQHNYLRISVTERCNLRCLYCMPEEGVPLSPVSHNLTSPEIVYLSELFVKQGVDKIRLTGGEPTVRRDIVELMQEIGQLRRHGLKELCITSNGISLHRKLDSMVESGLTGVNLSLDTLDPFQFTLMTRRKGHDAVMKSINRILEMNKLGAGIKLKINCVVMRGINEREIIPFVEMGRDKDLEVRFIEYMPFDGNKWSQGKMLSFDEMLALIRSKYPDVHKVVGHANDTSKTYQIPGYQGRIGFITSMTHNFCGTCNRLRITSDGNLKVCLFGNSEVSLRDILRESNNGNPIDSEAMDAIRQIESTRQSGLANGTLGTTEREARLLDVIGMAVKRKKEKHAGMGELENMKNRPMILIDGPLQPSRVPSSNDCMNLRLPTRAITPMPANSHSSGHHIPFHLLQRARSSFVLNQQRHKSTVAGEVPHTWTRVRYPQSFPGVRFTTSPGRQLANPTDLRSIRIKRKVRDVRKEIVSIRRSLGFLPFQPNAERKVNESTRTSGGPTLENGVTSSTGRLTHLRQDGAAHMVDISNKRPTKRMASAVATLFFSDPKTYDSLAVSNNVKGDAVAVARVAAIQAVKRTADLIPLAHPSLNITGINVDIETFHGAERSALTLNYAKQAEPTAVKSSYGGVTVRVRVECQGQTGIEMEAITGATIGAVTLYDMLKAVDKAMVITGARVVEKKGGKSGDWRWDESTAALVRETPDGERAAPQLSTTPSTTSRNDTTDMSDVAEWNRGLADEFSTPNHDEEEQNDDKEAGEGTRPASATQQQSLHTTIQEFPKFPYYRARHLGALRAKELQEVDRKFQKLTLEAKTVESATAYEEQWKAATEAVVEHFSEQIRQQIAKWQPTDGERDAAKDDAGTLKALKEAKRFTLQSRDLSSEHRSRTRIDHNYFTQRSHRRYADFLKTGLGSRPSSQQ